MGRRAAYFVIALTGFAIGVVLYLIGVFVIPYLMINLPQLSMLIDKYKYLMGALASGIVGSIIAVVIAYLWATKSEF